MEDFGDEGLVGDAEGFVFLFEVVQALAVDADVQDGVLAAPGDSLGHRLSLKYPQGLFGQQGVHPFKEAPGDLGQLKRFRFRQLPVLVMDIWDADD